MVDINDNDRAEIERLSEEVYTLRQGLIDLNLMQSSAEVDKAYNVQECKLRIARKKLAKVMNRAVDSAVNG